MKRKESTAAFYKDRGIIADTTGRFNVFENQAYCAEPHVFNRRDFYKISLFLGTGLLSWHDKDLEIDRPALFISTPFIPFAWQPISDAQPGYFCLFTKEFLQGSSRDKGQPHSSLFVNNQSPVLFPGKMQSDYISTLFKRMLVEIASDYPYKYEILQNQLQLLIHEAAKMQPPVATPGNKNAAGRITTLFLELLERQFPIDSAEQSLQLKTAGDYATKLGVHVNHLNHAVKETTGKATSTHIAARIITEAKALLLHTDWPVSVIAYSLGFAYPTYFYNFFKKSTGYSPLKVRSKSI